MLKKSLAFLIAGFTFANCGAPRPEQVEPRTGQKAMATCDCPPGTYCDFYAEDPGSFFCAPSPPPIVYVPVGQFCGFGTDEQGRTVDFRCRLDAHCDGSVCVCTHFPGGPCGSITCPEGTFCDIDEYGTGSCGMYVGECSGT